MRTTRAASRRSAASSASTRRAWPNRRSRTGSGANTEEAAQRGVFGVPSFVIDGEVFWGADAIDFAKAFLVDPAVMRNDEMRRVDAFRWARRGRTESAR